MASIRDIKLRISSTQNIEHITKAMKMVSAARLKKAQERLESARPYARKIAGVTLDLATDTSWSYDPLMQPHQNATRVLVVVFTGDKGLAGGYHNNIADNAIAFQNKWQDKNVPYEVAYYVIGKKGNHRFLQRHMEVFKRFERPVAEVTFTDAQAIAAELLNYYTAEQFDYIYLYYAKFHSAMNQKPRPFQLLPIDPTKSKQNEESGLFIFEPDRKELVANIMPRYIESEVYRAFLETEVGELGARMTAMSAATDNADEIIEEYQLEYNRLRQAKITKELNEIVGGADALKENKE